MKKVIYALQQIISGEVERQKSAGEWPLLWIKRVFFGDPRQIPETNLPAIAIQPMSSEFVMRWSRYDQKNETIEIRIINNEKNFYEDRWQNASTVKMIEQSILQVETINDSWEVIWESICWLIQKNNCLKFIDENWDEKRASELTRIVNVNYVFNKDRGFPTYEVIIQVSALIVWDR